MKYQWTMAELKNCSNKTMLRCLIDERLSELKLYSPLAEKLKFVLKSLDSDIDYPKLFAGILEKRDLLPLLLGMDEKFDVLAERMRR